MLILVYLCCDPNRYTSSLYLILFNSVLLLLPCVFVLVLVPIACFCMPCLVRYNNNVIDAERDVFDPVTAAHATTRQAMIDAVRLVIFNRDDPLFASCTSCAICLESFEAAEEVRVMTCDHYFHRTCLDEWLVRQPSCPTCISTIS